MKPGTYVFEPHAMHGHRMDAEEFPFGYLSRVAPNGIPSPIFELRIVLGTDEEATRNAEMIVAACNAMNGEIKHG
jgi:hypothetical protein